MTTRTRFAPSPTGALHIGVIRSALFAWLLARHDGGQFLLRIEDTDQKREVEGGVANITDSLQWLGLQWDEGPEVDGPYAPYIQSQRLDIYQQYARELVAKGLAYADPYSAEELQTLRETAQTEKRPFLYRDHRPANPPEWDGSQPLRIRLEPKAYGWDDAILGRIDMGPEMIDDYIIIKADGFPTYNFCHIIDDHLMGITHILRSQEFISSVPKFLATHDALGWESPINAIVPPVLGETGGTKLSKRKGAKPVLWYRDAGYVAEAMLNYIVTLGWNDGTEKEIFDRDELVAAFSLDRVQKSGARFDEQRLLWMNGQWLRRLSLDELYPRTEQYWPRVGEQGSDDTYRATVLGLVQDRLKTLAELPETTGYFFTEPTPDMALISGNKQLSKLSPEELRTLLTASREALVSLEDWSPASVQTCLNGLLETTGSKPGILFSLIRTATTWAPFSPALDQTLSLLGKERSLARIETALAHL